ncbi:DUF488 domain-containing protein [Methylomonas sp. EFPC3]|uniref:DUF488 domain-containing protein n=1 Tax=Methylomonas sp. EFPC3 TaxID=3021710 RepID=UPI002416557E|nr:DUF488 domain-containing protein [Methylomonas sp. EFPC3]WFP49332.1 DUF488 domain-containing protein [Methylomonas sp. EFPC3]
MIEHIFTIGGYGYTWDSFFDQLNQNNIDVLVDIRQRRGMRGKKYAFLNATALQAELRNRNIAYVHMKELAPTTEIRHAQKSSDATSNTTKRQRSTLSECFISLYNAEILSKNSELALQKKLEPYSRICFFCVEGAPKACHRVLVADWLSAALKIPITHIGALNA